MDSTITVFGSPNQTLCIPVQVLLDGRIENTERFTVHLNSTDDMVVLHMTEAEVLITDSDGSSVTKSYSIFTFTVTIFDTVVIVGFVGDEFRMVLEGNFTRTCASFGNTPLDRDVPIQFSLLPVTAEGTLLIATTSHDNKTLFC